MDREDVSGIADAKEIIINSFINLDELYGKKEKKEIEVTHKKVEHTKVLKSVHLSDALYFLEKNPLTGREVTKHKRKEQQNHW